MDEAYGSPWGHRWSGCSESWVKWNARRKANAFSVSKKGATKNTRTQAFAVRPGTPASFARVQNEPRRLMRATPSNDVYRQPKRRPPPRAISYDSTKLNLRQAILSVPYDRDTRTSPYTDAARHQSSLHNSRLINTGQRALRFSIVFRRINDREIIHCGAWYSTGKTLLEHCHAWFTKRCYINDPLYERACRHERFRLTNTCPTLIRRRPFPKRTFCFEEVQKFAVNPCNSRCTSRSGYMHPLLLGNCNRYSWMPWAGRRWCRDARRIARMLCCYARPINSIAFTAVYVYFVHISFNFVYATSLFLLGQFGADERVELSNWFSAQY